MKYYKNSHTDEIYCGDKLYPSDAEVGELEGVKHFQKKEITRCRYEAEVSGKVYGNSTFDTDRVTQGMLGNAVGLSQLDPTLTEVDWKAVAGGWSNMPIEDLLIKAKVVGRHVQDCFSKECRLHKLIDACETKEEVLKVVWEE